MLSRSRVDAVLNPAKRILVAGDLILDEFIWGKVSRISPEAPVPVVEVVKQTYNAGGAANVARNLRAFVENVHMMGLAGEDIPGHTLSNLLTSDGIQMDCVQLDPLYQTTCKTRIIARSQQVVRVDRERRTSYTEGQRARALAQFDAILPTLDAVILEDYAKGLFDQALVDEIIRLARNAGKIVTVDPNPANTILWKDVTSVKPNRIEAFRCAGIPWTDPVDPPLEDAALLDAGTRLLEKWQCETLLVTLSEQGMMLFQAGQAPQHIPPQAHEVYDVSGAGDTAIALFTAALTGGATPLEAAIISNHASGIVVGKLGTATVSRAELLETFPE